MTDTLGTLMRRTTQRQSQRLAAQLGEHGVTPAESLLLRMLHEAGAVAPSALAERLGFTRGAVTKLVDRLRAKRLVVRAGAGRADRRYQTIALTGAGAVLVPTLAAVAEASEAEVFGALTVADRAALDRILRSVADPLCSRD